MKKILIALSCVGLAGFAPAAPQPWTVSVDPAAVVGPIRPMNALNGGPTAKFGGTRDAWRHARIPFGRTHDMNHSWEFGGPHTIDIDAVFPDFSADENDPKSYDFFYTDLCLDVMKSCGTEPFFRLGPSIESGVRKYHTHPPKDFAKWARVCEHVIRHCNEGWADGRRHGVRYWEIWFEPDLGDRAWSGTKDEFLALFKTTATHLKGLFPNLKIGGPGFARALAWKDDFIPFCRRENVPLDFYSWHCYTPDARKLARLARDVRAWLDANGFEKTESFLDEWNYVKDWSGGAWSYSRQVESGAHLQKGAAFAAAAMSACQDAPVDGAMYYDTRLHGGMNMLFDSVTARTMKGYYPFYAWGKLLCDYGTQVKATAVVPTEKNVPDGQLFVTAAKDARGGLAIWLARYADDNNVLDWRKVKIRLPEGNGSRRVTCHLTDDIRTYTEVPLDETDDGVLVLTLVPNSFALVEIH